MVEHECPRCHREVELPLGALCRQCRAAIERRAAKWANVVSVVSTAGVAVYVWLTTPPGVPLARNVGLAGIVVWFLLSNMVVRRILRQWTR